MSRSKGIGSVAAFAVALVAVVGALAPSPAAAETVYPITFPVAGDSYYYAGFGACRDGCSRTHEGIDIMTYGWKGVPVVAARSGKVVYTSVDAGRPCCSVVIEHRYGYQTRYLHLNNDTPGTDDGRAVGLAPGVEVGARVEEGQIIGWVGDSGNTEDNIPHLHFEIRAPDGRAIDPYPSLRNADRIDFGILAADQEALIALSQIAYPDGARSVAIAADPAIAVGTGTTFDGPVLVGPFTAALDAELDRLAPERVVLLGIAQDVGVARHLPTGVRIVDEGTAEGAVPRPIDALPGGPSMPPIVIVDDGRRIPKDAAEFSDRIAATTSIQRWAVARLPRTRDLPTGPMLPLGEVPAGTLVFRSSTGWVEAPRGPTVEETAADALTVVPADADVGNWSPPAIGLVTLTRRQVTAPTLRFLLDLFGSPPDPLWR